MSRISEQSLTILVSKTWVRDTRAEFNVYFSNLSAEQLQVCGTTSNNNSTDHTPQEFEKEAATSKVFPMPIQFWDGTDTAFSLH